MAALATRWIVPFCHLTNSVNAMHSVQGRPKAPPATQNASQKSSGDKSKEVGEFKFGQLILRKMNKIVLLPPDGIF